MNTVRMHVVGAERLTSRLGLMIKVQTDQAGNGSAPSWIGSRVLVLLRDQLPV